MLSFLEDDAAYLIGVVENQGFPVFPDAPEDGKIPSAGEDVEEPPQGLSLIHILHGVWTMKLPPYAGFYL